MQSQNTKEIMDELSFERMIERGMEDVKKGRLMSPHEMKHRIRTWATSIKS